MLIQIIQGSLAELFEIRRSGSLLPEDQKFYLDGLISYLSGDSLSLSQLLAQEVPGAPKNILTLRLKIRLNEASHEAARLLIHQCELENPIWRAESLFVAAKAFETTGDADRAAATYRLAATALESVGATAKAGKAALNAVICDSHRNRDLNFIKEFHDAVMRNLRTKQYENAAVGLICIVNELEYWRAYSVALTLLNRAITLLRDQKGSLQYDRAIAQKAFICFHLGRLTEFRACRALARVSDHAEVREVADLILDRMANPVTPSLPLFWQDRMARANGSSTGLSEMENRLVHLLISGPKSKKRLTFLLWGSLREQSADERFKNLLLRIRRKHEGIIEIEKATYRLSRRCTPPVVVTATIAAEGQVSDRSASAPTRATEKLRELIFSVIEHAPASKSELHYERASHDCLALAYLALTREGPAVDLLQAALAAWPGDDFHPEIKASISRVIQGQSAPELSTDESRLEKCLASDALSIDDLAERIYGPPANPFRSRNRIKNLIHRFRRKRPGRLLQRSGRYRLMG